MNEKMYAMKTDTFQLYTYQFIFSTFVLTILQTESPIEDESIKNVIEIGRRIEAQRFKKQELLNKYE